MKKGKRTLITLLTVIAAVLAVAVGSLPTITSLDLDGFAAEFQAAGETEAAPAVTAGIEDGEGTPASSAGTRDGEEAEAAVTTATPAKTAASLKDLVKVVEIALGGDQDREKSGSAVDDLLEDVRKIKEDMIRLSYSDILSYDDGGFWIEDLSFLDGYDISGGTVVVRISENDTDDDYT